MTTLLRASVSAFALTFLAACADMPMQVSLPAPQMRPVPAAPDRTAKFIADERAEARRLDAAGILPEARRHWRYVAALLPSDVEAKSEIARLDTAIRARVDALVAQGEAALTRRPPRRPWQGRWLLSPLPSCALLSREVMGRVLVGEQR